MEARNILLRCANEMFLRGEIPEDFIAKYLPDKFLAELLEVIYLDIDILLPEKLEDVVRRMVILMAILFNVESELSETEIPNVYRLYLKDRNGEIFALDELSRMDEFLNEYLVSFLKIYYEELEKGHSEKFENFFIKKVDAWNKIGYVRQERIFKLSRTKTLPAIECETGIEEKFIPEILNDYQVRMDAKRLENAKRFKKKLLDLISNLKPCQQYFRDSIMFLLGEIENGGMNIKSLEDLFPKEQQIWSLFSLSDN